ncbi:MAG TPA: hypothetical protein VIU93_11965 [Gallionellaceae bacterium]
MTKLPKSAAWLLAILVLPACAEPAGSPSGTGPAPVAEGIRFVCAPDQVQVVALEMDDYLASLGIASALVVKHLDTDRGVLNYVLNTPGNEFTTLDFAQRPAFGIRDEMVSLPARSGRERTIAVVSRKEIVLTMLQHGRLTEFRGGACDVEALKDHVGIRQNTAAWAAVLNWVWPDGEAAQWNKAYWDRGTPVPNIPLHEALSDVFLQPESYSFGCYTAAKMVIVQGMLDFYRRVKKDPERLQQLEHRLYMDNDPLVDVEPEAMWDFESAYQSRQRPRPGKLLRVKRQVAPGNFVPGDWVYFLNTDSATYAKTGYEGSNPIYLGRGRFSDYFNDHHHAYSFEQKLDQVYQWRNGVFSFSRDGHKRVALTDADLLRLGRTPAEGGLVMDFRGEQYFLGFEELPAMPE